MATVFRDAKGVIMLDFLPNKSTTRKCVYETLCHQPYACPEKRFKSERSATQTINKASQAIQSPRTVPFFLLVSLLDGDSFPNVLVKGIVAFKHLKKTATLTSITDL